MSKTAYKKDVDPLQWYMSQLDLDQVMSREEERAFGQRITQARQRAVLQGYPLAEETFLRYFLQSDFSGCLLQPRPKSLRPSYNESVHRTKNDSLSERAEKMYAFMKGLEDWRHLRKILLSYNGKNKEVYALCDSLYGPRGLENEFIERNLRFGAHRSHKGNKALDLDDRIQEASLGLLRALDKFDFSRDIRFITYARWWITAFLQRSPQADGDISIPPNIRVKLRRIARAEQRAMQTSGGKPTLQELAAQLHISQDEVKEMQQFSLLMHIPSLDDALMQGDDSLRYDTFAIDERPAKDVESQNLSWRLYEVLQRLVQQKILSAREYTVLQHRFELFGAEEKKLKELGEMYGLSRERIRQVESVALQKLKENLPVDFAEALK